MRPLDSLLPCRRSPSAAGAQLLAYAVAAGSRHCSYQAPPEVSSVARSDSLLLLRQSAAIRQRSKNSTDETLRQTDVAEKLHHSAQHVASALESLVTAPRQSPHLYPAQPKLSQRRTQQRRTNFKCEPPSVALAVVGRLFGRTSRADRLFRASSSETCLPMLDAVPTDNAGPRNNVCCADTSCGFPEVGFGNSLLGFGASAYNGIACALSSIRGSVAGSAATRDRCRCCG